MPKVHPCLLSVIHLKDEEPRHLDTGRNAEERVLIPESELAGKPSQCFV